jgi:hypothetical protein
MDYAFDTALNRTSARFKTSLAGRNGFFRALAGAPAVHTLVAVYEFAGRTAPHAPEAVRVSLMSDEFMQTQPEYRPSSRPQPILVITVGNTSVRYPLGIVQKVEEWSAPNMINQVGRPSHEADPLMYAQRSQSQLHIERTATALIPICDFLDLLHGKSVSGTVAGLEFDLNEGVVSGLRQFAAKMPPASLASASVECK